ncbi:hypothetical protein [Microbacterium telephonicum]|uniref:hypothetical protein n=1 Tax=Microbacterium telephonicum TaxID=1714841 RepID=UPI001F5443E4|nr:hypothetical protein [Microbacterium telephonicum]
MTPAPLLLIVGPPAHGVTRYGADVADALVAGDPEVAVLAAPTLAALTDRVHGRRAHLHVTDRLLGDSPEQAADAVGALAARTRLTITVHDVPQPSDGRMFARRRAAYARFAAAAERVVVNSAHEQALWREWVGDDDVDAIPLGARRDAVPTGTEGLEADAATPADGDLTVIVAGYVYPGKGHVAAIDAVRDAAAALRDRGERVGSLVVRAIGAPSRGHEDEAEQLRRHARGQGVDLQITGFLDDGAFAAELAGGGIPLAAHEHVSASRSMLDWVEAGRRPLVVSSRYAQEMDRLRPGTLALYEPDDLAVHLAAAWSEPARTRLAAGTDLRPSVADVAREYRRWWDLA